MKRQSVGFVGINNGLEIVRGLGGSMYFRLNKLGECVCWNLRIKLLMRA